MCRSRMFAAPVRVVWLSQHGDNGRADEKRQRCIRSLLTPDGLRVICAGFDNDPEKIGIHMLEMLTKFRNEGVVD